MTRSLTLGSASPSEPAGLWYDKPMPSIDAELVERRFSATAPASNPKLVPYALLGLTSAAVVVLAFRGDQLGVPGVAILLLPWCLVLCLFCVGYARARRLRRQRAIIGKAWQHVQLEAWSDARPLIDEAMRHPVPIPTDRCQALVVLAALAEQENRYDSAGLIYERLLIERIGDAQQLQQAQIALAAAKIKNEELTDGIGLIDRLDRVPMPLPLKAVHTLVRLYQQVFMGQFEDAVAEASDRRALFRRYLSTRAGYGYALLGAAMHHLNRSQEAAEYWRDATTLVPVAKLLDEYAFLAPVAEAHPTAELSL